MKPCYKCNIVKSLSEFVCSNVTADGTIGTCKACMQIYRNLNKDKIQASRNKYLLKDGVREKMRECRRAWKQKILLENPALFKQKTKEYKATHRDSHNKAARKRAARHSCNLTDTYIKLNIFKVSAAIEVPQELIEIKRLQLQIRRLSDEKRNRITQ